MGGPFSTHSAWIAYLGYNEDAEALAKEEGFDHWWEAFNSHQIFYPTTDTNQPTTMPWNFEEQTATVKYFKRNPYFYQVDPAGNQLPYIDDVVVTAVNKEVYQAKIMSGESTSPWPSPAWRTSRCTRRTSRRAGTA